MTAEIVIMAAVAKNGVIGNGAAMPWHLGSDFRRFKALTMGKPQIMGRKTYQSIGKPLPGRTNIIISRNPDFLAPGCIVVTSLEDAVALARKDAAEKGLDEIYVQGGGEIYRQAMTLADRLRITHVETEADGQTTFPAIDPALWQPESSENLPAGERDDYPTRYVVYARKPR
ncbi:dihydrofolate reductase [Martelella sp. AD-3]|uniref:dihydrofolate reductase n=1 Tax=Martelella sp. AD-3 TaxID=686597 RepID=UPI000466F7F9|nr:dihydrofolate reductase [Martelella sp. AD-3]AMM84332.1 diacylglycerol kinase [Martelella sp. AD-3]